MNYHCHGCGRDLAPHEVHHMAHLGPMCTFCRSGRVTPIESEIEIIRVDGNAICTRCLKHYRDHPWDEKELSGIDNQPFLRIGCDGKRLKL